MQTENIPWKAIYEIVYLYCTVYKIVYYILCITKKKSVVVNYISLKSGLFPSDEYVFSTKLSLVKI